MQPVNDKQWGLKSKLWLELEGHPVIGEGRMAMLRAIDRYGSILQASREIGISYRKIRGAIRDMENVVGRPLVISYRGGGEGGGASLTTDAVELMDSYERLAKGFQNEIDIRFQRLFG
ncbi:MAG: winged helix-turn-helix domain-containing protein [Desulfobacterales bacterium]